MSAWRVACTVYSAVVESRSSIGLKNNSRIPIALPVSTLPTLHDGVGGSLNRGPTTFEADEDAVQRIASESDENRHPA